MTACQDRTATQRQRSIGTHARRRIRDNNGGHGHGGSVSTYIVHTLELRHACTADDSHHSRYRNDTR